MSGADNVHMHWGVRIPLRDGVSLSANLYLPASEGAPAAAICALTPYVAQRSHESAAYYAARGHPFLCVDVRGRGNSGGEFHPLTAGADGYDVVEWVARQPWCNGKVAMWGGSYLGYCQWATVRERPPHLVTVVPVAAAFFGVDFPLRNNVFYSYSAQWLTHVAGRTLQEKIFADVAFWRRKFRQAYEAGIAFKDLDAFVGNRSNVFQEWIAHSQRDEYWDRHNPSAEQYAQISMPVLTITGAYDADQLGALEHYRQHMRNASCEAKLRHYLVIGPWDHAGCGTPSAEFGGLKAGAASLIDMRELHRQWYAWTMSEGPKPALLQKRVAYYVLGAEQWRYAESLESVTSDTVPLYLRSDGNPVDVFDSGLLEGELRASEPDSYIYDPRDLHLAALESIVDPNSLIDERLTHAARGRQLVYHSAPFEGDVVIAGFFKLSLWLAIDQPDTDFLATVYQIGLDGRATHLTSDWLRARYRADARSAQLIDTTEPLRYDFERFMFVARRISRGCRLRLVVGPINSIYWQKNYNAGRSPTEESIVDARAVRVRLFHDLTHPSALYVPFGHSE